MTEIREQKVPANGLNFHVRSAGDPADPAVILLHGFPECGYSWRYQMPFLAAKGFHVLAPDLRGYGFSDAPKAVDAYRQDKLVADVMGILDAFGAKRAVVIGHDWGCALAWQVARSEPGRVRAVAGLPQALTALQRIADFDDLYTQLDDHPPGDEVVVTLLREGRTVELTVGVAVLE